MTKNEIIYTIFEKLNIQSDDSDITEELVSSLVDTKRAMFLQQRYGKSSWHMPIEVKQEICLEMSLTDKVDGYSCAGKILTSTSSIPPSIKIRGKEGPLNVRKKDGTEISMSIIPVERIPYLFNNRYTQQLTYCAVDFNNNLVIISKDNKHRFLKYVQVTDVFESPDDARDLTCDLDSTVEAWDDEYPLEASMVDLIVTEVLKDLVRTIATPSDDVNDATDDRKGR